MSESETAPHWLLVQLLPVVQRCLPALIYAGEVEEQDEEFRITLRARNLEGNWSPDWDFSIEVYPSGANTSLLLERPQPLAYPLLWQGQQAVWMDSATGNPVSRPTDGAAFEAIARKLRDLLT